MAGLFTHPDGCLRGAPSKSLWSVTFVGRCPHTKIAGAEFVISADTLAEAADYAAVYLCPPQMVLMRVEEYSECGPQCQAAGRS